MNRRIIVLASIALVAVFLVRWWVPSDRTLRSIPTLPDTQFDYTLTDFRSVFYNNIGSIEWIIEAPKLTHDSDTKQATIEQPNIEIHAPAGIWYATANWGVIERGEDQITLMGRVVIKQMLNEGERIIEAERLHHDRRERTIRSDDVVQITQPDAFIEAGGLLIDLTTEQLEFFDDVQGEIRFSQRSDARPSSAR